MSSSINHLDEPCLVVEFFEGFTNTVDPDEAEREEFEELLNQEHEVSFLQLVAYKIGNEIFS